MPLLRGIVSVGAGFLLLPLLMRLALMAVVVASPDVFGPADPAGTPTDGSAAVTPTAAFMALNLGLTALMAAVSAVITARLAPEPRYLWVLVLAFLVFAGGMMVGVQHSGGSVPTWYLLALPLGSGLSIALGGYAYLAWRDHRARDLIT